MNCDLDTVSYLRLSEPDVIRVLAVVIKPSIQPAVMDEEHELDSCKCKAYYAGHRRLDWARSCLTVNVRRQ
jgi:hypothetical protein